MIGLQVKHRETFKKNPFVLGKWARVLKSCPCNISTGTIYSTNKYNLQINVTVVIETNSNILHKLTMPGRFSMLYYLAKIARWIFNNKLLHEHVISIMSSCPAIRLCPIS